MSSLDRALDQRTKAEVLLSQITAEQRQLFDLVLRQELPLQEVAILLGIPEGTVKSRMCALRAALVALAKQFTPTPITEDPPSER